MTFHELCRHIGTEAGVLPPPPAELGAERWNVTVPVALDAAIPQVGGLSQAVVVEEGQDFSRSPGSGRSRCNGRDSAELVAPRDHNTTSPSRVIQARRRKVHGSRFHARELRTRGEGTEPEPAEFSWVRHKSARYQIANDVGASWPLKGFTCE